jgi:V8-like Glu-specific endopeptidase
MGKEHGSRKPPKQEKHSDAESSEYRLRSVEHVVGSSECESASRPDESLGEWPSHFNVGHLTEYMQEAGVKSLIGRDDRNRVRDIRAHPYRMICQLECTTSGRSSQTLIGTGWFASPRLVITAGHCVYNRSSKWGDVDWMKKVVAHTHRESVNWEKTSAGRLMSVEGWTRHGDFRDDIGAILLDEPIGNEFFGFGDFDDTDLKNMKVFIAGYPAELNRGTVMFEDANLIVDSDKQSIRYQVDTTGGQSGAPVMHLDGGEVWVVGIHNYGDMLGDRVEANVATRINAEVFQVLKNWKQKSLSD